MEEKDQLGVGGVIGLVVAILVGAVMSAFAVAIGARITNGPFGQYDFSLLFYGICAVLVSIPISSVWVIAWRVRNQKKLGMLLGVPLAIVPTISLLVGLAISPVRNYLEQRERERRESAEHAGDHLIASAGKGGYR